MAFAVTNPQRGVFGDMNVLRGNFTCAEGDAAGTVNVEGGFVMAHFHSLDSTGAYQAVPMRYSISTTGGVSTITVYNQEGVTTGNFLIISK